MSSTPERLDGVLADDRTPLSLKARETGSLALKRIFEEQLHQQQQQRLSSSAAAASSSDAAATADATHLPTHLDLDLRLAPPSTSDDLIHPSVKDIAIQNEVNEKGGSQLTILYAGRVCVYEDVPLDKAKAVLLLASGSGSGSYTAKYTTGKTSAAAAPVAKARPATPPIGHHQIHMCKATSSSQGTSKPAKVFSRSQAELPFARKVSLSRFLEKRKERLEEKAVVADKNAVCSEELSQKRPRTQSPLHYV